MKMRMPSTTVAFASVATLCMLTSFPALAISRVSSVTHSCTQLRDAIDREGAVIVTHPGSKSSGTLYDRYVSDSSQCQAGFVATDDWVPAKGGQCRLTNCQEYEPPFDY